MKVQINRLYRWTSGDWRPVSSPVYLLESYRQSSLGGYVATIVEAYEQAPGKWSPKGTGRQENVPMNQLTEFTQGAQQ